MGTLKLPSNPKIRRAKSKLEFCPTRRLRCYYGCLPGQCLNGQCPSRMHGQILCRHPDLEKAAAERQKQVVEAMRQQREADREAFFTEERRLMGMKQNNGNKDDQHANVPSQAFLNYFYRKEPHKSMRMPARPLCMLEAHEYKPPTGDYADLSHFLRLSTMPGNSSSGELVSEYRDRHSMEVWDGQKGFDRQAFKMKRDWLSVWGEFNVKEQRWRKAWVEKFGAEKV